MSKRQGRRSIRIPHYNYANPGYYFVTLVTQRRHCLFGHIIDGQPELSAAGLMTTQLFNAIPNQFAGIQNDAFICMPNHLHFVLQNHGANITLGRIAQWYKTCTTNHYIRAVKQHGWPTFPGKLWQRNYWERIIRNTDELHNIRQYIQNNPQKWHLDTLNPTNTPPPP